MQHKLFDKTGLPSTGVRSGKGLNSILVSIYRSLITMKLLYIEIEILESNCLFVAKSALVKPGDLSTFMIQGVCFVDDKFVQLLSQFWLASVFLHDKHVCIGIFRSDYGHK